jgi:hypothetical protein
MKKGEFKMPSVTWVIFGVIAIGFGASQIVSQEDSSPSKKEKVELVEPNGPHKEQILEMKKKYPERLTPMISRMMKDGVISESEFKTIEKTYKEIERR